MKKLVKRSAALLFAVMMFASVLTAFASDDTVWLTGDYCQNDWEWTSTHEIKLSDTDKKAKIKIHGYTCKKGTGHKGKCKKSQEVLATQVVGYGEGVRIYKVSSNGTTKKMDNTLWKTQGVFELPATWNSDAYYMIKFKNCADCQHWAIEGYENIASIS